MLRILVVEDNPLVANVRSQIEMVKEYVAKFSAGNGKTGFAPSDPVYQGVQKQLLSSKADSAVLKVRYADHVAATPRPSAGELVALRDLHARTRQAHGEMA